MKNNIASVCAVIAAFCSLHSYAAEYDSSIGAGVQYGGIFGWQASVNTDTVHGRAAIGVIGVSLGADISMSKYISIGATAGAILAAKTQSFNINYYPGGKYTEGWRIGIDAGRDQVDILGKEQGNFTALSVGYSFK